MIPLHHLPMLALLNLQWLCVVHSMCPPPTTHASFGDGERANISRAAAADFGNFQMFWLFHPTPFVVLRRSCGDNSRTVAVAARPCFQADFYIRTEAFLRRTSQATFKEAGSFYDLVFQRLLSALGVAMPGAFRGGGCNG